MMAHCAESSDKPSIFCVVEGYIFDVFIWLIPLAVLYFLLGLLLTVGMKLSLGKSYRRVFVPPIWAFGCLGATAGMIAGATREAIVSALLTGLLGLTSGLLAYLFGKESLRAWRLMIPFALIFLMSGTLVGLGVGGVYKREWEYEQIEVKKHLMDYEEYVAVDKEIQLARRKLGSYAPQKSSKKE